MAAASLLPKLILSSPPLGAFCPQANTRGRAARSALRQRRSTPSDNHFPHCGLPRLEAQGSHPPSHPRAALLVRAVGRDGNFDQESQATGSELPPSDCNQVAARSQSLFSSGSRETAQEEFSSLSKHEELPLESEESEAGERLPQASGNAGVGRRSLALFLPLMAAVTATSKVAAEVAAPELLEAPPSATEAPPKPPPVPSCPTTVRLNILEGSTLGVSIYPDFGYNPKGGGGMGTAVDLGDGRWKVDFDPKTLNIPPLSFDSTTFVGLPLPPPLKIRIVPKLLSGFVDKRSGQVNLAFKSKFYFTAGPVYSAPPLTVETILTTDSSVGSLREGQGQRLDSSGEGILVAVAQVPPVNDGFLDRFLGLPTDVLAVLPARFTFACE